MRKACVYLSKQLHVHSHIQILPFSLPPFLFPSLFLRFTFFSSICLAVILFILIKGWILFYCTEIFPKLFTGSLFTDIYVDSEFPLLQITVPSHSFSNMCCIDQVFLNGSFLEVGLLGQMVGFKMLLKTAVFPSKRFYQFIPLPRMFVNKSFPSSLLTLNAISVFKRLCQFDEWK